MKNAQIKQKFLNASESIGSQICKNAFWKDKQCNWIGRFIDNPYAVPEISTTLYSKALGPELYDGTSGIALFLSHLYLLTRREEYRRTAEGAITHALLHFKDLESISRFGFYAGYVGIGYSAVKSGLILNNQRLVDQGMGIFKKLSLNKKSEHLMDVISGNAGAIPALLEMYDYFHEKMLYDLSLHLGNELVSSAIKNKKGWSWNSIVNGVQLTHKNLTGLSHGAAGIGYSLLELFRKTDKKEFLEGAEQAFAYENQWFSKKNGNWPDFRIMTNVDIASTRTKDKPSYAMAWCHGAPGIALSRLRAFEVLNKSIYLKDARAAINTTIKFIKQNGIVHRSNYSLCHGLAGNSECLIYASKLLHDTNYKLLADNVGINGIDNYQDGSLPWPCGIQSGQTPGLMIGLSGIGYFYLRLHDSSLIPSILIISQAPND